MSEAEQEDLSINIKDWIKILVILLIPPMIIIVGGLVILSITHNFMLAFMETIVIFGIPIQILLYKINKEFNKIEV